MHEANQDRIDWAKNALDTFTIETYGGRPYSTLEAQCADCEEGMGDDYTAVQDLIGDLLHVAHERGWNTAELIRRAEANFVYEVAPDYQGD